MPAVDSVASIEQWRKHALCAGHPKPEWWYSEHPAAIAQAKAICRTCPVRQECLDFAVVTANDHGVWGGTLPAERRRLKRRRLAALRQA